MTFGCTLVVHENGSSFIWVLEQLVESRDGQKSITVMTDGDKAMANAIKMVFPEAHHRLYLWHLMMNVWKIGLSRFGSGFIKCINKY